ncbi:pentapeptide repeat-containing protein [Pseudonocardia sp. S2-4]|uniref:Pentapeptide repeat-containing protein n=1 Tax=Pseudonocardia humida TaxID=2800819 RepID=A0ABT0ZS98_9PSEU|nr:pentapeptide repeat-containing protein [Pseudonocardia humida]
MCCTVLGFARSADFAEDKPAGTPCRHLGADFRCGIHERLVDRGYRGCTAYDCFGAGQHTTRVTFAGADWRTHPELAGAMSAALGVLRGLHELRWHVVTALGLPAAAAVRAELAAADEELAALADLDADGLAALDLAAVHGRTVEPLRRAAALARGAVDTSGRARDARRGRARHDRRGAELSGAQLLGADLRGADLRAASLRGALLLAVDLRCADLTGTDLTGADLRDADVRGADLSGALFLTRVQVAAARGDAATALPAGLERPRAWTAARQAKP